MTTAITLSRVTNLKKDEAYALPAKEVLCNSSEVLEYSSNINGPWTNDSGLKPFPSDTYESVILADNPVAYWRLNETSGTIVRSRVAGVIDGNIFGTVTLGVSGATNDNDKGMSFSGAGRIVGNPISISGAFTIECWFKGTTLSACALLSTRATSGGAIAGGFTTYIENGVFSFWTDGVANSWIIGIKLVNDGNWHHLMVVYNGDKEIKSFVDGLLDKVVTSSIQRPATNTAWNIGWDAINPQWLNGNLDEVAIYSTALTPEQIQKHYNARNLPLVTSLYSSLVVADGAVAYWRLNETSGTTVKSLVAGVPDGALPAGTIKGINGALLDGDKAMTFSSGNHITVGNYVMPPLPITVEAWVRVPVIPTGWHSGIAQYLGGGTFECIGASLNFAVPFIITSGGQFAASGPIPVGVWNHLVFIITPTTASIYINNVLSRTGSHTSVDPTGINLRIGGYTDTGDLDDVSIYNKALTPAQIQSHYAARLNTKTTSYPSLVVSDGAVAYWRLNELSGTVARNMISGAPDGTITNNPTLGIEGALSDGDKGMGFNLSGPADQHIGILLGPWSALGTTKSCTIECWIKRNTGPVSVNGTIFGTNSFAGAPAFIAFANNTIDELNLNIVPVTGTGSYLAVPFASYRDNRWHHLVGVLRRSSPNDITEFWIDGILLRSGTLVSGLNFTSPNHSFIGSHDTLYEFIGSIDECSVYHTALTPEQILSHYNARTVKTPTYSDRVIGDGAVAYWRLNESSGSIANSSVGNYPGTITGGVTLGVSGATGDGDRAMLFNGTNARIDIPVGTYSAFGSNPFSLEAWIYPIIWHDGYIIDTMNAATNGPGVAIFVTLAGALFLKIGNGVGNVGTITTAGIVPLNKWTHIVGTCVPGANYILTLYMNGELVKTQSFGALGWNLTTTLSTSIGSRTGTITHYFNGSLDEITIYKTALTPQQIQEHYNSRLVNPKQSSSKGGFVRSPTDSMIICKPY